MKTRKATKRDIGMPYDLVSKYDDSIRNVIVDKVVNGYVSEATTASGKKLVFFRAEVYIKP